MEAWNILGKVFRNRLIWSFGIDKVECWSKMVTVRMGTPSLEAGYQTKYFSEMRQVCMILTHFLWIYKLLIIFMSFQPKSYHLHSTSSMSAYSIYNKPWLQIASCLNSLLGLGCSGMGKLPAIWNNVQKDLFRDAPVGSHQIPPKSIFSQDFQCRRMACWQERC